MVAGRTIRRCLEAVAQHEVNRPTEEFLCLTGHLKEFIGRHCGWVLQGGQQVDVTFRALPSPGEGSEHCEVPHAVLAAK